MENKKSYPEWKLSKVKHTILEGYVTEHIFEKQFLKLTPEKFTSGWWSAIINDQRFFFLVSKTLNDVDRRVVEILSQKEAQIFADIVEDGDTFEANAMIKAKGILEVCKAKGMIDVVVLADDSGLEVDYMDKAQGVYSARFLGEDTSYDIKNQNLIDRLEGVEDEKRTARFVCAIAAAFPDGTNEVVRGTMEGRIGYEIAGENGFGYDPIFYYPPFGVSFGVASAEQKNTVSHRARALSAFAEALRERLIQEK